MTEDLAVPAPDMYVAALPFAAELPAAPKDKAAVEAARQRVDMVALAHLMTRHPGFDPKMVDSDTVHRDMMAHARRVASEFLAMLDASAVKGKAPAPASVAKPVAAPVVADAPASKSDDTPAKPAS